MCFYLSRCDIIDAGPCALIALKAVYISHALAVVRQRAQQSHWFFFPSFWITKRCYCIKWFFSSVHSASAKGRARRGRGQKGELSTQKGLLVWRSPLVLSEWVLGSLQSDFRLFISDALGVRKYILGINFAFCKKQKKNELKCASVKPNYLSKRAFDSVWLCAFSCSSRHLYTISVAHIFLFKKVF